MSDYLERIASKISNQASVVRPRLAARFEPLADGQLAATTLTAVEDRPRAEEPADVVLTTARDSIQPKADSVPAKSDRQSAAISDDRAWQLSSPPQAVSPAFDRTEPVVGKSSEEDILEITPSKIAPSVKSTPSDRVNSPTSDHPFEVKPLQPPAQNKLSTKYSPKSDRNIRLPEVESPAIFSTSTPTAPPSLSLTVTNTSSKNYLPTKAPPDSNKASLPPIQVNIGQIVVRAIAPKPPEQKSSRSRPAKPSLEQYLQARSNYGASGGRGKG